VPFKDYNQIHEPLELPINGKVYRIPPLGFADGIDLTDHLDPKSESAPMTNEAFRKLLLGDAYDEMLADNVPDPSVRRAALTALADFQSSRGAAEIMWETGGDPKVVKERIEAGLAATTPPDEATTTKPLVTGTGTKTSRKS
jgi:hypothetical protein